MGKVAINIATGSILQSNLIAGIDLGTTNSLVAIVNTNTRQPQCLRDTDGEAIVPSIVHINHHHHPMVGLAAIMLLASQPERTIYSVKRLMGKSVADVAHLTQQLPYKIAGEAPDAPAMISIDDRLYSPIELSGYILADLKKRAEHVLKNNLYKVVITVPAYFNDAQRQATRDAGKLAGLDVIRIVNEPTAASLAYGIGLKPDEEKTIAVYDLGGGTFDISILSLSNGIFEVLSTHGDTQLGGDDMDNAIATYWQQEYLLFPENLNGKAALLTQQIRLSAERAKIHLTTHDEYTTEIAGKKVELNRATFHSLIEPLIQRTLQSCTLALQDAGLTVAQIDDVVMVGGSTRVPQVTAKVSEYFNKKVHNDLNPEEVVALGAALQADILAGNNTEMLLLDVTPLSLGIETMGGLMEVLINRNSKIPCSASKQYTTHIDGQTGMRISVYQGERDLVADNRKLAEFVLSGIPAMPAGLPKVAITFMLDADGILRVSAKELRSGIAQSIEVKPQYGMTDEQVENMLMASFTHAKEDIARRALIEASTEARQMIETTLKFITKHKASLTEQEVADTNSQIKLLEDALKAKNKADIQKHTELLNTLSTPYAERIMDEAINNALKGKNVV